MSNKRLDIELMRILACFFVIYKHTGVQGFYLFSLYDSSSLTYLMGLFLSVFCKFAVPAFFAISGALLLGRDEGIIAIWKRRALKVVLALLAWSVLYYMYLRDWSFNLSSFLKVFASGNVIYHFWYLYAYLAFIIFLPIMRRLAKALTVREYIYLLTLYLIIYSAMPIFECFTGVPIEENIKIPMLGCSIFIYPLLGYFLYNLPEKLWDKKKIIMLWLVNIILMATDCALIKRDGVSTGAVGEACAQIFRCHFVIVNCACIFVTCHYFEAALAKSARLARVISSLGGATFGIYLMHVLFIGTDFSRTIWSLLEAANVPAYLASFLLCVGTFLVCYIITIVLKKIPLLRRLV